MPNIKRVAATLLLLLGSGLALAQGQSMQAIVIEEFGGPEVLQLGELPIPRPSVDEILLRVHAAAINPVDTGIRAGRSQALSGAELPYVPGFDVSGVVVAIGPGVTNFAAGDEVFAMLDLRRGGGYAQYAIVKASEAAAKPAAISHAEAASVPLVALTAWQALFDTADLQAGETVLIHAGAGGVGSVAVQLAKWRGARVVATASDYNHEFLYQIGADLAVDYRTQRFEDFVDKVDVVLDPVGGETQLRSMAILRDGGRLVSIVGLTPEGRNPGRNIDVSSILVRADGAELAQIGALLQNGTILPIVSHRFPLADAALAHEQSETRRTRGKIILEIE